MWLCGMENPAEDDVERMILRKYYLENDFFLSIEGILKVLSIAGCTLSSVVLAWGGWCGARGAAGAAGGAALCAGALLAALSAAAVLLGRRAPMTRFVTDIILSTVIGVSMLLVAILSVTLCEIHRVIDYVYGPLALVNSMLVIGSAVVTYMSVSKKWDAVPRARNNNNSPDTNDLEV